MSQIHKILQVRVFYTPKNTVTHSDLSIVLKTNFEGH